MTRICNSISKNSSFELENCNCTWKECITHSRNQKYAYRCQEVNTSQDIQGIRVASNASLSKKSLSWHSCHHLMQTVLSIWPDCSLLLLKVFMNNCQRQSHVLCTKPLAFLNDFLSKISCDTGTIILIKNLLLKQW